LRRIWPFLGPAFVASIAYIDPGNFATNIQAGSEFGYELVWVVVAANLMGVLIQTLSAKLGVVSGLNLPEAIRRTWPWLSGVLWIAAEVVAVATDLAELLGAALGLQLLFGMPLAPGALLAGAATWLILVLRDRGFRLVEALITGFLGVIAVCYLIETVLGKPSLHGTLVGLTHPGLRGSEQTLLAAGILGATVMPHVIYLHSALTQDRVPIVGPDQMRRVLRFQFVDVVAGMSVAGLVNLAILTMAAATFHSGAGGAVSTISDAYRTLEPVLGSTASVVFGLSLVASGLASSVVGTLAGQIIMQGFLNRSTPTWVRRTVTMVPPLVIIAVGVDPTRALVISQVVLSFGIPFAVIPLVVLTARRTVMGALRNHPLTTVVAGALAALVTLLNTVLIIHTVT
jgi:manganese transport protein